MGEKAYVDLSDFILKMDKQQAPTITEVRDDPANLGEKLYKTVPNPAARYCPNKREHGTLGVHGSGAMLICGKCSHHEGIVKAA